MVRASQNERRSVRFRGSRRRAATAHILFASAAAVAAASTARAAVYVFDPGDTVGAGSTTMPGTFSDGSGAFNATTPDFYNVSGGSVGPFGNTTADTAIFGSGGTAGNVTVGTGGVTVGTIDFNAVSGSYNLSGGPITLGGAATIYTDPGAGTPIIASAITATGATNFTGTGTLTLTGADTFGGQVNISSGTLVLGGGGTDTVGNFQFVVGTANSTAGASASAPNVVAFNLANGTTLALGNNLTFGLNDAAANQLLVGNISGKITTGGQFTTFSGGGNGDTAVINISGGSVNVNNLGLSRTAGATTVLNINNGGSLSVVNAVAKTQGFGGSNNGTTITGGGPVTVNLSGTGSSITFNDGGGSATLAFTTGTTGVVNQSGGTFTVLGAGNLLFGPGTSTYNLSGGTLNVGAVGVTGTPTAGSSFIFNGGTLQANKNATAFFAGLPSVVIGGGGGTIDTQAFNVSVGQVFATGVTGGADGGLSKIGSGTLTLTGASTYTGPTNANAGTLVVSGTGSVNGSSQINVNGAGAKFLQLGTVASIPAVSVLQGTLDGTGTVGPVTVANSAAAIVANGNGSSGTLTTTGNLSFLGAATGNLVLSAADLATNNTAPIAVGGALSSTTAGKVTLNLGGTTLAPGSTYDLFKYNSFTGDVSGTTPTDFAIGAGLGGRVAGSSSLVLTSTTGAGYLQLIVGSADNNIRWTGNTDNTWQTGQTVPNTNWVYANPASGTVTPYFDGDNVTFDDTGKNTNPVNISAANVSPASTTFNNSTATYTVSSTGGFGIAGPGGLVKNAAGVLTLNTSNTYAGGTTLNAGTLNLGNAAALGTGTLTIAGGTLDNTTGGTVQLANGVAVTGDFAFTGSSQLNIGTGTVVLTGNRTITVGGQGLYVRGPISESGTPSSLTLAGGGTTTLAGANTFTGGLTVNGGTVNFNSGGGSVPTVRGPVTINNGATVLANVTDALGYTNASTSVTTLTVNQGGLFRIPVPVNQGIMTNVVLAGGTIQSDVDKGDAAGTGAGLGANAAGLPGQFNFGVGYGITALTVGAGPTTSFMDAAIDIRNSAALPINTASGATLVVTQAIIDNQYGTAPGSIVKTGPGTLVVMPRVDSSGVNVATNGNSYHGGTTVAGGSLFADNDANAGFATGKTVLGSGTTTVAAGATLGGDGVTGGPVIVNGTITAGPDGVRTGVLTTTAQTWNTSGGYVAKVNNTTGATDGSASDVLVMSSLTIAPMFTVTLSPTTTVGFTANNSSPTPVGAASTPVAGSYIVLAKDAEGGASPFNTSSMVGSLTLVNNGVSPVATGDQIILDSFFDGTNYDLIAEDVAAPEPTSLLLVGLVSAPLALGRRRRAHRRTAAV